MKDDIYLLGDAFEQEIFACKAEENSIKKIKKEYEDALANLRICNEKRAKIINKIRLKKIQEIDDELEKSKLELKKLQRKLESILSTYCRKNGHKLIKGFINPLSSIPASIRSSRNIAIPYNEGYTCAICGHVYSVSLGGVYNSEQINKEQILEKIYDDESLSDDGITYSMIQEKISTLTQYIMYIKSLKQELCKLFGHDFERKVLSHSGSSYYVCKCCGVTMDYSASLNINDNAKYIILGDRCQGYLINIDGELGDLSLPTFENYQKSLELEQEEVQEQKDKPKKLIRKLEPWGTTPSTNLDL